MRCRPGPSYGWPPLFAELAHELAEALPPSSALVIEHDGEPLRSTCELLCVHLLARLPMNR